MDSKFSLLHRRLIQQDHFIAQIQKKISAFDDDMLRKAYTEDAYDESIVDGLGGTFMDPNKITDGYVGTIHFIDLHSKRIEALKIANEVVDMRIGGLRNTLGETTKRVSEVQKTNEDLDIHITEMTDILDKTTENVSKLQKSINTLNKLDDDQFKIIGNFQTDLTYLNDRINVTDERSEAHRLIINELVEVLPDDSPIKLAYRLRNSHK